ncbi:hypothetical protein HDV02_000699, partial [Globomyces sp. JEL0801]
MTIQDLKGSVPNRHTPSIPIPASLDIQFTPNEIHPWYLEPIRQCILCKTVHMRMFCYVAKKFNLCQTCYKEWPTYKRKSHQPDIRKGFDFPMLFLEDIVESYNIPSGAFKIVFLWARNSVLGAEPARACYSLDFLLNFKSKRYSTTKEKVLASSGRTYIVPDKYYKSGPSNTTLVSADPTREYPSWSNLCKDINSVLNSRSKVTANIVINRMDDLSTSAFHLRNALARLEYPTRTFIVVKSLTTDPNQSGTTGVSALLELLECMADFTKTSSVASL